MKKLTAVAALAAAGLAVLVAVQVAGAPGRAEHARRPGVVQARARRQARDLPPVRQHALQPRRQPQRRVRPGADAAPAELPEAERHALHERPHDPDLAHRRRDPVVADRPLPRPTGSDRVEQLRVLRLGKMPHNTSLVQVLDEPGRPGERPAAEHDHGHRHRRRRRRGCRSRARAATSAGSARRTSSSRTTRPPRPATSPRCSARARPSGTRRSRTRSRRRPTSSASPSIAPRRPRALREQPDAKPDRCRTSRAATPASTRSTGRSTSTRRSHGASACVERHERQRRSPIPTATAASRASTGCSRRTRSATSSRCRRTASRSRTATSRTRTTSTRRSRRATRTRARRTGPGELGHEQQLKAYDTAFENFFQNLEQHGINRKQHALRGHRGRGRPLRRRDRHAAAGQNWLLYNHSGCTNLSTCSTNTIGEVGREHQSLLPRRPRAPSRFDIHFDDAPAFYVNGQPAPTDPTSARWNGMSAA